MSGASLYSFLTEISYVPREEKGEKRKRENKEIGTAGIINILYFNHHFSLNFLFEGAEAQAGNLIFEGACMLKRVPLSVFVAHI